MSKPRAKAWAEHEQAQPELKNLVNIVVLNVPGRNLFKYCGFGMFLQKTL